MHNEITVEVNIHDVTLVVTGNYYPEEPRELYDGNMEGYPGCAADFELDSVFLEGIVITTLLDGDIIDLIIEEVIKTQEN
jgi:hypothetical protein